MFPHERFRAPSLSGGDQIKEPVMIVVTPTNIVLPEGHDVSMR